MKKVDAGGGWPAVRYVWQAARRSGGLWRMFQALRTANACKTCALGMGGVRGGMVDELGRRFQVCKKSVQAMAADMQPPIPEHFWKQHSLEQLRQWSPRDLEHAGRLVQPLRWEQGQTHFHPASWNEALQDIAQTLHATSPEQVFFYFSGRSSNEAGFLLQLLARLYGSNHVNNCSYYCHQASGVGLNSSLGSGTATVVLEDLLQCDLVFLIGGNPASNHPRLVAHLVDVRRRGGQVVVINPVVETGLVRFRIPSRLGSLLWGSPVASEYVQPHIGGDLALLSGVAKAVLDLGAQDEDFLRRHTTGYEELRAHLESLSWDEIERKSGVTRQQMEHLARLYAQAQRVIFAWTMGITHHRHGVQNVQAIANLALLRGMVGKPGAGLLPIRGHSNVQGMGTVGVTPELKQIIWKRLEEHFGVRKPEHSGLDTLGCMQAAHQGRMRVGICLGGNLYGANPHSRWAAEALGKLELLVYLSTTLNTGHVHALGRRTWILPVLARDEEPQPTTQESMFNYIRFSQGGPQRHQGPRSEVEVIAELGERLLGGQTPVDWNLMRQTRNIRQALAQVVPGLEKLGQIDRTREEFHIPGRTFHQPVFATPDGKARLHVLPLPELAGGEGKLRVMTVRSEGQFNTVVYEQEDLYRGQSRRDVILVHPGDIRRLGLVAGKSVRVRSEAGEMIVRLEPYEAIKPGNALMYYPEANALVPTHADPQSRTPAFKCVVVEVERV